MLHLFKKKKNQLKFINKLFSSLLCILKTLSRFEISHHEFSKEILNQILRLLMKEKLTFLDGLHDTDSSINFLHLSVAIVHLKVNQIMINEEIFTTFDPSLWSRQILVHILLVNCKNFSEFDLQDFIKELKMIAAHKVDNFLATLLEKISCGNSFKLHQITDLITILQSSEDLYRKFKVSDSSEFPIPSRLHEAWLKNILLEKCVGKDLQDIKILMRYRPALIERLLNADNKNQLKIGDFVKIFKALQQCTTINFEQKCNKLIKLSSNENTTWLPTIELFLIDDLIMTKLKNFNKEDLKRLRHGLQRIYHTGWSVNSIKAIVERIKSNNDIEKTSQALRTLYEYEIDELHSNVEGETAIEVRIKFSILNTFILFFIDCHKIFKLLKNLQKLTTDCYPQYIWNIP